MNTIILAQWEWFKLRYRWMPWILFVILILFFQVGVWGTFLSYQSLQTSGGQVILPTESGRPKAVACNDLQKGSGDTVPPETSPQVIAGLRTQCEQGAG